jgi:ferredoxin
MYPELFRLNDAGFIEVVEMECYPEDDVDDAVKHCPQDCIRWEEV